MLLLHFFYVLCLTYPGLVLHFHLKTVPLHNKQNSKWLKCLLSPLVFTEFWVLQECHLLAVKGKYSQVPHQQAQPFTNPIICLLLVLFSDEKKFY